MCKKNNRTLCTAATESFLNIHAMAWVSLTKATPWTWAQYKAHNMHQICMYSNEPDNDINVDWPKHAGLEVINASKANPVLRLFRTEHFCMAVMKRLNPHRAQELKPAFNIGSVVVMIAWKSHQNEREDVHKMFIYNLFTSSHVHIINRVKVMCIWRAVQGEGSELGILPRTQSTPPPPPECLPSLRELLITPWRRGAGWAELISIKRDMQWNGSLWTELFLTG